MSICFRSRTPPPAAQGTPLFQLALLLFLLSAWPTLQAAIPDQQVELSQFTAGGHVLGFKSDGFYVASGDHMLHVGFVGTDGVVPESAGAGTDDSKAQPLTRVSYADLWSGVSLYYDATAEGVAQSSWEIAAGADAKQIQLRYNAPLEIAADGSLKINYETGWMRESAPIAWQKIDGQRRPVEVAFRLLEASENEPVIGFRVGHYDPAHPLLIDPTLEWNTFMGSSINDTGKAIALDGSGNVYVTGTSLATWGTPVNPHAGGTFTEDVFVAKLDTNGMRIWNTFMGSRARDEGTAITVDGSGNVYVAGYSNSTWGTPVNAYAGDWDAFVARLDANGVRIWNTFMGSANVAVGEAIAVDSSGNVYLAGYSESTWGAPVNPHADDWDAFAAKLDASGTRIWNTFMGGLWNDEGYAIAVDGSGNVYVAGHSTSTWGTPVNGGVGIFASKLDANGVRIWNTFMGSSISDSGKAIAVDGGGNVYVAGDSYSTWGTPMTPHAGTPYGVFAAKLDANGVRIWNTFMGSAGEDHGDAIAVDGSGNVYVAGRSSTTWGTPVNPFVGGLDAFAAKLDASGVRIWNTFMGGVGNDIGKGIVEDGSGNVYVAGWSIIETWGSPVNPHAGGADAFAAKLKADSTHFVSLKSLGDINIDNGQDTAVVQHDAAAEHTDVTVKKLNNSIINQFQFADGQTPVDVEIMEDINNNGAPEMVMLGIGSTRAEVRDSLTGQFLGAATFSPGFTPIDLQILPDQNGNQVPELAVLQKKAGATRVEIRDALSGDLITRVYFNPNFTPKDLEVLPNVGGTAALDLAVLQDETDPQQYDRVEIRDMKSKQRVRDVWFGKGFEVKQLEVLQDVNHNGKPELAVLRVGSVNVLVKDAGTGKYIRNVGFNPNFTPLKLLVVPDTDKDGEQELGLMARNPTSGQVKIELRDVNGGQLTRNIWYGNKEQPLDAAVYPDINRNGSAELGVLGRRIDNPDELLVRIKDARTGAHIQAILF